MSMWYGGQLVWGLVHGCIWSECDLLVISYIMLSARVLYMSVAVVDNYDYIVMKIYFFHVGLISGVVHEPAYWICLFYIIWLDYFCILPHLLDQLVIITMWFGTFTLSFLITVISDCDVKVINVILCYAHTLVHSFMS